MPAYPIIGSSADIHTGTVKEFVMSEFSDDGVLDELRLEAFIATIAKVTVPSNLLPEVLLGVGAAVELDIGDPITELEALLTNIAEDRQIYPRIQETTPIRLLLGKRPGRILVQWSGSDDGIKRFCAETFATKEHDDTTPYDRRLMRYHTSPNLNGAATTAARTEALERRISWINSYSSGANSPDPRSPVSPGNNKFILEIGQFVDEETKRYEVTQRLGYGGFGAVYAVIDHITLSRKAVKVVYPRDMSALSVYDEICNLIAVRSHDPADKAGLVRIKSFFMRVDGALCIVTGLHGVSISVYQQMYRSISYKLIPRITYEIVRSLEFLHSVVGIIHTDIKPANILFDHKSKTRMTRLCDLGNSVFKSELRGSNLATITRMPVTTLTFRSPEVVFRREWTSSTDIWSLGCTLFQIYTGKLMFMVSTEGALVWEMVKKLGPMPVEWDTPEMRDSETMRSALFHANAGLRVLRENSEEFCINRDIEFRDFFDYPDYDTLIHFGGSEGYRESYQIEAHIFNSYMPDLIRSCCRYRPEERITLAGILEHPFLASVSTREIC